MNPSVEEATNIPNELAQYSYCVNWWEPYLYSTDFFTNLTLSTNGNYIPTNVFGYQESQNGNNYLGINTFDFDKVNDEYIIFREDFCGGKFSESLKKNTIYQFEFWISRAENCGISSNALDVVITYDTLINVNNIQGYGYLIWSMVEVFEDTLNWVKISTCFRAKGGERAFAIGNFHDTADVLMNFPLVGPNSDCNYLYLDNFSLIECPTCCPDQFPNEEQVHVYSNPSSNNEPATLQIWLHPNTTGELKIYDSAGRLVAIENYSDVQNTFIFENLAGGIYHYFFNSSEGVLVNGKVLVSGF